MAAILDLSFDPQPAKIQLGTLFFLNQHTRKPLYTKFHAFCRKCTTISPIRLTNILIVHTWGMVSNMYSLYIIAHQTCFFFTMFCFLTIRSFLLFLTNQRKKSHLVLCHFAYWKLEMSKVCESLLSTFCIDLYWHRVFLWIGQVTFPLVHGVKS